jgi:hypothetical protein
VKNLEIAFSIKEIKKKTSNFSKQSGFSQWTKGRQQNIVNLGVKMLKMQKCI